jgi:DNA-directed RNA polymerase specialized sigma24 family protein
MRCPQGQSLKLCQQFAATQTDECLEWPYARFHHGHGQCWDGKRVRKASNLVCEIVHGPAPADKPFAAHSCGNPSCCNPRHLRWASPYENVQDRGQQGRTARGERAGLAKLTDESIRTIRQRYEAGESQQAIADDYDVWQTTVSSIIRRKTWAHVE